EILLDDSQSHVDDDGRPQWDANRLEAELLRDRTGGANREVLDKEGRYHLFCVREIIGSAGASFFGLMFGPGAADRNSVPREGAAIASDPKLNGVRFGSPQNTNFYFRTALHEIGHAMGLLHHATGQDIMTITQGIVDAPVPGARLFSFAGSKFD